MLRAGLCNYRLVSRSPGFLQTGELECTQVPCKCMPPLLPRCRSIPAAAAVAILLLLFVPLKAAAHDIYHHWRKPDNPGVSCCNNNDCRPTRAYMGDDGLWRAWDGYKWLMVPPSVVLPTDYGQDGRSHLCEMNGYIFCFTPGQVRG